MKSLVEDIQLFSYSGLSNKWFLVFTKESIIDNARHRIIIMAITCL